MTTIRCNGNWVQFNSHQNQYFDEEEQETLSLCDLPTNDIEIDTNSKKLHDTEAEDFEFRSSHSPAARRSPENMCDAEELFFEGQILPLRHHDKINRSASMSVVRSNGNEYRYKPKIRNQFHSHPSPSPQIRTESFRTLSQPNPKTSSLWSFLQVGLVKQQEIGLSDLKSRSKRFGSHNSNSSSTSSSMNSTTNDQNQNQNKYERKKKMKKKQRLFSGGCKCSVAVSIDGTIKETVPKKKTTKEEESKRMVHLRNLQAAKGSTMTGEGRRTASRHRTFEWLKQLSIEA